MTRWNESNVRYPGRSPRRSKIAALAMALVFVLGACGGDDEEEIPTTTESTPATESSSPAASTVSAQEYVSTLCTEMQNWLTALQEGQAEVQETVQPGAEPAEGQAALATFFDGAITATQDLVTAIQEAGVPDVEGGEEISADLLGKFEEAQAALEDARAQVDTLPVDDRTAFAEAATQLGTTIQTQLQAIGDALSSLSQPELDEAAAADPACTQLSPTGG
ncbi:MAG: hypothetical protein M3198_13880 [Actinomycetota bacterium]|nr:hypothetical protein [Actinomycetota bacterium]